jgi:RNA polymerase sigma-70 factor, ECF subfamily
MLALASPIWVPFLYCGRVSEPTVAELVAASKAGRRDAFATLYQRYHRMVHAVVLATAGARDAEDLVQDVFVVALREIASLDDGARFGGWLSTIARRRAIDHHRRKREATNTDVDDLGRAPAPTSEALEALRAIRALPEAYRETLMMRLVEGLTGPEIAELTGMTAESVRVNLCRGMKLLRERLGGAT